jgi:hypothetical protein
LTSCDQPCRIAARVSVTELTRLVSACRHLVSGEAAQSRVRGGGLQPLALAMIFVGLPGFRPNMPGIWPRCRVTVISPTPGRPAARPRSSLAPTAARIFPEPVHGQGGTVRTVLLDDRGHALFPGNGPGKPPAVLDKLTEHALREGAVLFAELGLDGGVRAAGAGRLEVPARPGPASCPRAGRAAPGRDYSGAFWDKALEEQWSEKY